MASWRDVSVCVFSFVFSVGFLVAGFILGTHEDVGESKPKSVTSLDENRTHSHMAWVVTSCYSLAILLMLIYLIEKAPWHKSQLREHSYLAFCLAMIMTPLFLMWWDPTHGHNRRRYDKLQHLLMATLVVRIATRMTAPSRFPGFFKSRSGCELFERHRPKVTLKASRVVTQLEELVEEVLGLQSGLFGRLSDSGFNNLLLFLFLAGEVMVLHPLLFECAEYVIYPGWAIIWALMLNDAFKTCFRIGPRQQEINSIVQQVLEDRELLRYVLWTISMATLMEVGTYSTVEMLSEEARWRGNLGVIEKAVVIDALQKRGIRLWKQQQQTAFELICSCHGEELTLLKNLVDIGGDVHTLYKLVYEDVTDNQIRRGILEHLRTEALALRSGKGGGAAIGVKILSDIDDTLYSSGGSFPAGCDKRFPKHRVYPGFLELCRVLDKSHSETQPSCNLVFLSARPHVYKSVTEDHSYHIFRRLLEEEMRLHSLPTLLPGDLSRGTRAFLTFCCLKTRAWRRVGEYKYSTFKRYSQLYLEYDYIFFGDNGQGDLLCGQHMLGTREAADLTESESEGADEQVDPHSNVLAVIIHEVMAQESALALEPPKPSERGPGWRDEMKRKHLIFHRTYLGAASQLHEMDPRLVSAAQLREIAEGTLTHFEADVKYCEWRGSWSDYEEALREDLRLAEGLVAKAGLPKLREMRPAAVLGPRSSSAFSICSQVSHSSDGEDKRLLVD